MESRVNTHFLSRVFLQILYVKRPQLSVFTPCFRLYYRTAMQHFLSPLRSSLCNTTTYSAIVLFAPLSQMGTFATFCNTPQNFSSSVPQAVPISSQFLAEWSSNL